MIYLDQALGIAGELWSSQVLTRLPAIRDSLRIAAWVALVRASPPADAVSIVLRRLQMTGQGVLQRSIGIAAVAIVLVALDFKLGEGHASTVDSAFVLTLWQIDATVITVAAAVLVFVLQAYAGNTPGSSLRLLVRDSRLVIFLYVGVLALIVLGVDGLLKRSILVAVAASAWVFLWLVPLLIRTVDIVSSESALDRAVKALTEARRRARTQIRFETAASEILHGRLAAAGIVFGVQPAQNYQPIRLNRTGFVYDLRLNELIDLAANRADPIALTVSIGSQLDPDTVIGYLPDGFSARERRRILAGLVVVPKLS